MSDTGDRMDDILRKQKEELAALQENLARMEASRRAYERTIASGELCTQGELTRRVKDLEARLARLEGRGTPDTPPPPRRGGYWDTGTGDAVRTLRCPNVMTLLRKEESVRQDDHAPLLTGGHVMAERQPSSHAQWANTTLAPGFWVAVTLRPGAAPSRVYVGRVQAVDERGMRLTLVDWRTGGADNWDFYAPWSEVTSILIATSDHATEGFGDAAHAWQEHMQGARPDESP